MDVKIEIDQLQWDDLSADEQQLVERAKAVTRHSYAPYSHFHVGAAALLKNGEVFIGCNQENAAFGAGICAERSALFAAGAVFPDMPVTMLAIAASDDAGRFTPRPVTPCGLCRQVLVETETRHRHPVRILMYGSECIYAVDGIGHLMPLTFSEF